MAYLRFLSPDLAVEQKRRIAKDLTDAFHLVVPGGNRETTTVHFDSFRLEDVAVGGELLLDRKLAEYHLEVTANGLSPEQKQELVDEFTPMLGRRMGLSRQDLTRIHIKFVERREVDAAMGGMFVTEFAPLPAPSPMRMAPLFPLVLAAGWLLLRNRIREMS